jgi:hypothetical protein
MSSRTERRLPGRSDELGFASAIRRGEDVSVFVIDVGVEQPRNIRLGDLRLAQETIPRDGELLVETEISQPGMSGERVIELLMEEPDSVAAVDSRWGSPYARATPACSDGRRAGRGRIRAAAVFVQGLETGVHHGMVRVLGEDGLAIDDVRHFSIQVQEAWPVLLAAPENASLRLSRSRWLRLTCASRVWRVSTACRSGLRISTRSISKILRLICLLDPTPLTDSDWTRLAEYVQQGGGLALVLGSHARSR